MIRDFYRRSVLQRTFARVETIQDILEGALYYNTDEKIKYSLVCANTEEQKPYSYYNQVCDLAKSGYLQVTWEDSLDTPFPLGKRLVEMTLTVEGQKLLDELRQKSALGRLKTRLVDLLWVVLTAVATTLATLKLTGH